MRNKYKAHRTAVDGLTFDSKKEARHWLELKTLADAGEITELERQVPFKLTPTIREPDTTGPRGGIKRGRVIERPSYYVADFVYKDADGNKVVEDVKSPATRTPVYVLKRKLMLAIYHIRIREV